MAKHKVKVPPTPKVPKKVATATLSGRVTLLSKPTVGVGGIEVMASARVKPQEVYFAVTKPNGDFLIMGLVPAEYTLTFADFPQDRGQNKVGYLPRSYDGTSTGSASVLNPPPFKVGPGALLTNMDVRVVPPPGKKKA
ncbi:MAG: hypothetical protein KGR42_06380 [Acidobacteria bacterium]|nr:hypothetical protein [Acidobacteriota bacterium]